MLHEGEQMNCKICGKEINFKDADTCGECDSEYNKLKQEYKKLEKTKIIIILIMILFPIIIFLLINSQKCSEGGTGISPMSSQEIDAFNSNWIQYNGTLTGTQIKVLINKIIANSKTYEEEPQKQIILMGESKKTGEINIECNIKDDSYFENLNSAYKLINSNHTYTAKIFYDQKTALIHGIAFYYETIGNTELDEKLELLVNMK